MLECFYDRIKTRWCFEKTNFIFFAKHLKFFFLPFSGFLLKLFQLNKFNYFFRLLDARRRLNLLSGLRNNCQTFNIFLFRSFTISFQVHRRILLSQRAIPDVLLLQDIINAQQYRFNKIVCHT